MRAIGKLLRLRRRSDKVKLALGLFLLGAVLGWDVAFGAAGFLMESGEPVEYVLAWGGNEASLEGKLRAVSQHEGVICASRQREYSLVMGERQLTVIQVSPEYLSACFGLRASGAGREFFLGSRSYASFCGAGEESPARLKCLRGEEGVSGTFPLCGGLPVTAAMAKGSSAELGDSQTLRVMLESGGIEGRNGDWLMELGFSIENQELLTEAAHRLELLQARLSYGGLACLLALALGVQLFAAGRRESG